MNWPVVSQLVLGCLAAFTPTHGQKPRPKPEPSDDPVGDARRRRQERARQPGWLDQKMVLRNANSFGSYWF